MNGERAFDFRMFNDIYTLAMTDWCWIDVLHALASGENPVAGCKFEHGSVTLQLLSTENIVAMPCFGHMVVSLTADGLKVLMQVLEGSSNNTLSFMLSKIREGIQWREQHQRGEDEFDFEEPNPYVRKGRR